jgi:hypothetical protein
MTALFLQLANTTFVPPIYDMHTDIVKARCNEYVATHKGFVGPILDDWQNDGHDDAAGATTAGSDEPTVGLPGSASDTK